jgi:hypothetical protein
MRKEDRYVAVCAAASVFALVFALFEHLGIPTLWYFPFEHRWSFAHADGLAMGWYGRALGAIAVAGIAFAVARLATHRWQPGSRTLTVTSAALIGSYVVSLVVLLAQ